MSDLTMNSVRFGLTSSEADDRNLTGMITKWAIQRFPKLSQVYGVHRPEDEARIEFEFDDGTEIVLRPGQWLVDDDGKMLVAEVARPVQGRVLALVRSEEFDGYEEVDVLTGDLMRRIERS